MLLFLYLSLIVVLFHHSFFLLPFLIQDFVTLMKQSVTVMNDPEELKVDRILPGVNTRLNNIHNSVVKSESTVLTAVKALGTEVINAVSGRDSNTRQLLAQQFAAMAVTMSDGNPNITNVVRNVVRARDSGTMDEVSQVTRNIDDNLGNTDGTVVNTVPVGLFELVRGFKIQSPRVKSIRDLYSEFYGVGDYCGKPFGVMGGIERLNEMFGSSWRRGSYSGTDRSHYNRVARIAYAVRARVLEGIEEHPTMSEEEIIEAVLVIYEANFESRNKSLRGFVEYLLQSGAIPRGSPKKVKGEAEL